jgi:NAD(P)-dependent dehydrogenase (short-subunit alcohol dehydrogenase family)
MGRRLSFDGKRCLVTGAASGIGRATAIALAQRGARLVLTDVDAVGLERTGADIRARGGTVLHAAAFDISDGDRVAAFADEVHAEHGTLDVVMNVAGVSTWGPVQRLDRSDWRRMIEINLMGPIHVIDSFVGPMVEAKRGGHLVNVSSAAGLFGLPWHGPYSASKFGLRGVSEVLRFDLRRYRIGVTLVCPGAVDTGLVETMDIVGVDRSHPAMAKMTEHFRRTARTPEQVADTILDGAERRRSLVFTSHDIRALYLVQRFVPPLYDLIMRVMNDRLVAIAKRAAVPADGQPRFARAQTGAPPARRH